MRPLSGKPPSRLRIIYRLSHGVARGPGSPRVGATAWCCERGPASPLERFSFDCRRCLAVPLGCCAPVWLALAKVSLRYAGTSPLPYVSSPRLPLAVPRQAGLNARSLRSLSLRSADRYGGAPAAPPARLRRACGAAVAPPSFFFGWRIELGRSSINLKEILESHPFQDDRFGFLKRFINFSVTIGRGHYLCSPLAHNFTPAIQVRG